MRLIALLSMGVVCGAVDAAPEVAMPVQTTQASLQMAGASAGTWVMPESVDCKMHHNLEKLTGRAQGVARVETTHMAAKAPGNGTVDPPTVPQHPAHGSTAFHPQTQRVGFDKSKAAAPGEVGSNESRIRIDAAQLAASMSKHHPGQGQSFKPESYRFQVFNGQAALINAERVATSPSLDLTASELASGKLTLAVSLNSLTPAAPTWVVVVRAITANHRFESPQLVCTIRR